MSETNIVYTAEYKKAVETLLFQLADDDFFFSYRGSEWLGLAPHIEEDIAYSSITQDTMGHASMYYQLLENLGLGNADNLAHLRPADVRKNCILTERPNGEGYYMDIPEYDWAYAVVRNYFYTLAKKVKIDSLKNSTYQPLAESAVKVNMELYYHLLHWKTWFTQLVNSTETAKQKMAAAIESVMSDFGDLFSFGKDGDKIVQFGLIEDENTLLSRWRDQLVPLEIELKIPESPVSNGRNGEHTEHAQAAIEILSEVRRLDPAVSW